METQCARAKFQKQGHVKANHISRAVSYIGFAPPYLVLCYPRFRTMIAFLSVGIAAYPSWMPTIAALCQNGIPTLISDFCEEAIFLARKAAISILDSMDLEGPISEICLNPYRSPLSCQGEDNHLPSYSNCFIFWLGYL